MEKPNKNSAAEKNLKSKFMKKMESLFEEAPRERVDLGVLATDFRNVNQSMEDWQVQREKKGNIYKAFSEYILCLEDSLEREEDSYKRYLLEQEIKALKKEQKKYYVPSMLEGARLDLLCSDNEKKQSLENSNYNLIKIIEKRFKK